MTNELIEVHNTLCGIKVNGDDTIAMARCLITLRDLINKLQEKAVAAKEAEDGE